MAKTLWDINFSTLDTTKSNYNGWATKATNTLNLATGVYNPNGSRLFVNAVDIDWNGATLDSTVISTTGDLLKYIKAKSNLTLGTTSTTAAAGNHTHSNYLTKVLKLEKKGTSTIDLLANTTYTLTVGDQTLAFKTPTDQTGTVTKVKVGSTEYTPSSGVVSLPAYPTVPTYSQGTNININSNTISHATPTAKTNVKGNKTTQLLATITTDSQGHVTDYDVITPAELWSLLKSYADALYEPKSTTVAVTGISLNKSSLSVAANGTGTITATIAPSNATNKTVNWTSSNTSIATVTTSTTSGNAATVTWQAAGSVTITATAAGNTSKTAQCTVTCNPVPATASASIGATSISRPKNSTLASISWSSGSAPATIESGKTGTLTKGTVTGTYGNDNATTTVTTSNFTNKPTITSSNTNVISVGTVVKNGSTTLTANAAGKTTITVKDGSTTVNSWSVTVTNASNTSNVTSSTTFTPSAGSISGTTITAPTVTADTTVTITAKYGGKTASQTVTYTAKKATPSTKYYYSAGTTEVTTSNYTSANNAQVVNSESSIPSSLNISSMKGYVYIVLPNTKEPEVFTGSVYPNITKTITSISGHTVYKVKVGTGCTCTIVNSGNSQNLIQ